MSAKDDHPDDVEQRWDPNYSDQDFVPDRTEPFTSLAGDYGSLSSAASTAKSALNNVIPTSWTGDAATACGSFVTSVTTFLGTIVGDLDGSATASNNAARSMSDAIKKAQGGVKIANQAQADHKNYEKDNWVEKIFADDHSLDLALGVGVGNDARGDALNVDKAFARALDGPDQSLSNAKPPEPPNPIDASDPDQAALLAKIMQPVAAALKADGDTQRAQDAAQQYRDAIKAGDGNKAKQLLAQYAKSLSPAELTYMLDHIDENDLATGFAAMDPKKDRDIYNAIAQNADPDILARLADTDPNHYWHPTTGGDQYIWEDDGFPPGQVPGADPNDLRQGALGDCHDLSALAAVEQAHPGYLESHIKANANGTYTVTLYKDGQPVEVTVTPDVPYQNNGDGTPMGSAYDHGSNGATAYQLYEKALAQSNAEFGVQDGYGYSSLNGGWPSHDWKVITGQEGQTSSTGDTSPQDLAQQLSQHKPVTADTNDFDQNPKTHNGQEVIGDHSYRVVSVNSTGNPPTVTLANPWNPTDPKNGTITVTWDEFKQYYGNVDVGSAP